MVTEIISGGAKGVDTSAKEYAILHEYKVEGNTCWNMKSMVEGLN